jgi:hypothetical protein
MRKSAIWFPLCFVLLASAGAPAVTAKEHSAAARKAENAKDWKKAAQEWTAAYQVSHDVELLVSIGDAYANLGDTAAARRNYLAYLADPIALDADGVRTKLAALEAGGKGRKGVATQGEKPPAVAASDLDLDMGAPAADVGGKPGKKGKTGKKPADDLSLAPAPGLELSAAPSKKPAAPAGGDLELAPAASKKPATAVAVALEPSAAAGKKPAAPAGGDLELAPSASKKPATAVAVGREPSAAGKKPAAPAAGDLELSLASPPASAKPIAAAPLGPPSVAPGKPAPLSPPAASAGRTISAKPVAAAGSPASSQGPGPSRPGATELTPPSPPMVAVASQPRPAAPPQSLSVAEQISAPSPPSRGTPVLAYVTSALAVGALGVGGYYYMQAGSDADQLHSTIRSGGEQAALLEKEQGHKNLSFGGLAAGVVLAGLATTLFIVY